MKRTDDCMLMHLAKKQYLRDEYGTNLLEPTHKKTKLHTFNVESPPF